MGKQRALYFGAWDAPGHYLFEPGGRSSREHVPKLLGHHIDGQYAPKLRQYRGTMCWPRQGVTDRERSSLYYNGDEFPQGQFLRHEINGFTMISWWDRNQGDQRSGCNSNFILEGGKVQGVVPEHC